MGSPCPHFSSSIMIANLSCRCMLFPGTCSVSHETAMWLFKRPMAVADAAADINRLAVRLPRRMRDRVAQFGLAAFEGFELESIALAFAITVIAIETSAFPKLDRDRLQDRFTVSYEDQIQRLRLTRNLFELHRPFEAVVANDTMRTLRLKPLDQLDLLNLRNFLQSRLYAYRQGNVVDMMYLFLGYLEASDGFEGMLATVVFIADSIHETHEHVNNLNHAVYLVDR